MQTQRRFSVVCLVLYLALLCVATTAETQDIQQQNRVRTNGHNNRVKGSRNDDTAGRRSLKSGTSNDRETPGKGRVGNSPMVFVENAGQDSYVGTGNPGDRVVWYNTTWTSESDSMSASSAGYCVVLRVSPNFKYYCHYGVDFGDGTLTFEGVSNDYGEPAAFMTITGGTGEYKGAIGLVSSLPPASVDDEQTFVNTIYLQ